MPHTIAEKVLARRSGSSAVSPGDHVVCDVDVAMVHDMHVNQVWERFGEMGADELWDPSRVVCVMDHIGPSHDLDDANAKVAIRDVVEEAGIEHFYDVGTGISHEVLPERGHTRPGELVVGTDSHTTTHGAFGAAGTAIGDTEMAYVFATGSTWFRVPETVRFDVSGSFGEQVSAKDLILHVAGEYGTDVGRYRSLEFAGPAVEGLPIDDRMTLTNMAIELGAKFGFTPVDDAVTDYVDERTDADYEPVRSDDDAEFLARHEIDVSDLEPQVAEPHRVGNVVDVGEAEGVALDQVFVGSCTNGKYEDLRAAAEVLDGREVADGVRLIVTPASREIYSRAERDGIVRVFNDAGAVVTNATCGACPGLGLGVLGDGEVCLAAQNRNFIGRMGSNDSEIYLSSPETAAASAITGRITDPREV